MNVERLHAIALDLRNALSDGDIPGQMNALLTGLTNQVNNPADANAQTQVSNSRISLDGTLRSSRVNGYAPTWQEALDELGVADVMGNALADQLDEIFARHQITVSVARDEVSVLNSRLANLVGALDQLNSSLQYFQIGAEELEPGEIEVTVLIPRRAVRDELVGLGNEFVRLQRLLGVFVELTEGSRVPIKVRSIASSNFATYVEMGSAAAATLAKSLNWILDAYKKILDIREARARLSDLGLTDASLSSVDDVANTQMANSIDELTIEIMRDSTTSDEARRNELRTELTFSLRGIAQRIDEGYNIDVRIGELPAEPTPEDGEDPPPPDPVRVHAQTIANASMKFINRTGKPILHLEDGQGPKHEAAGEPAS